MCSWVWSNLNTSLSVWLQTCPGKILNLLYSSFSRRHLRSFHLILHSISIRQWVMRCLMCFWASYFRLMILQDRECLVTTCWELLILVNLIYLSVGYLQSTYVTQRHKEKLCLLIKLFDIRYLKYCSAHLEYSLKRKKKDIRNLKWLRISLISISLWNLLARQQIVIENWRKHFGRPMSHLTHHISRVFNTSRHQLLISIILRILILVNISVPSFSRI